VKRAPRSVHPGRATRATHFRPPPARTFVDARALPPLVYAVLACPRCRRSRVVDSARKSFGCGVCGKSWKVAEQRVWFSTGDFEEAQRMVGLVNARLANREAEFQRALLPTRPPMAPKHDDPYMAAAAATRQARGDTDRADRLARALSVRLGDFAEGDLLKAATLAGLSKPAKHLARMLETHVLYEPRAGRYKAA
jgi:hypothetical protein